MSKTLKTIIILAAAGLLAMTVWQYVRNSRLDEEIKSLEVERTLKQKEIDSLNSKLNESDSALQKTKSSFEEQTTDLHKQNDELLNKITSVVKKNTTLDKTIGDLKDQLSQITPTPPEVVEKECPELPVLKALNAKYEEKIGAQAIQISLQQSLIANKDKEINLFKGLYESYSAAYSDQKNLVNSLQDKLKLDEREITAYKKKDSFKWLPKFSAGVAFTCDPTGSRGCVAGPSIQLGWRF